MSTTATFHPLSALLLSATVAFTSACSDSDGDDGEGDGTSHRRVGWVDIAEVQSAGRYFNVTSASFWREPAGGGSACGRRVQRFAQGECSVTTLESPTCATACTGGQVCTWSADCSGAECADTSTMSEPLQAGVITITGGSGQPTVTATPGADGTYEFDVQANEWWSEGDALTVSAPGATFPAFSLGTTAPAAPAVTTDLNSWTPETFTSGLDVPVEWTPGDGSYRVVVAFVTDVELVCVTEDDGRFDVPADAIAVLGDSPEAWMVSVDYTVRRVADEGADGEFQLTTSTSGASTRIVNP